MDNSTAALVPQIHAARAQLVLAASGGGSRAVAELLEVPGASRTVLEAAVPYSEAAMIAWLGSPPEQFCSPRTVRAMAVAGFERARKYGAADDRAAGVACTASLASDRPKRGEHRAHVALQTAARTAAWSLTLEKGRRSRAEEEHVVSRMVLNAVADAAGVGDRLDLSLVEGEVVEHAETVAPQAWQDLLLCRIEAVPGQLVPGQPVSGKLGNLPHAVFPGAFNPLHVGHLQMVAIARQTFGVPVALELSIVNVDKPPLDYTEIAERLRQFSPDQPVWLTRAPTFVEKSRIFPGATFIVGVDTLQRIAEPRYYGNDPNGCLAALQQLAARSCRFLVFARTAGAGLLRLGDIELPEVLRDICEEVPPEQFREDISSTELRRQS